MFDLLAGALVLSLNEIKDINSFRLYFPHLALIFIFHLAPAFPLFSLPLFTSSSYEKNPPSSQSVVFQLEGPWLSRVLTGPEIYKMVWSFAILEGWLSSGKYGGDLRLCF